MKIRLWIMWIITLIVVTVSVVSAQEIKQALSNTPMVERLHYEVKPNQWLWVASPQSISSVAIAAVSYEGVKAISEADTFFFRADPHAEYPNTSNLWVLPQPVEGFKLWTGDLQGNLTLIVLHVPRLALAPPRPSAWRMAYCEGERSVMVATNTWRAGLPPPKEAPAATIVRHLVVHHSAGSNTATQYTDVVRNIYVFHTQSNGWNDIGYNFLIAQDGTIFEGRDGQGRLETDNVLGAHFCGKNSGTMGVCLLGDYQAVAPPEPALRSLLQLLAWKLKKENLDVLTSTPHPSAMPQGNLSTLAGHRDGCATECPGNLVYARLNELKLSLAACGYAKPVSVMPTHTEAIEISVIDDVYMLKNIYPIDYINLIDITGKKIDVPFRTSTHDTISFDVGGLSSGMYIVRGKLQSGFEFAFKIMVP